MCSDVWCPVVLLAGGVAFPVGYKKWLRAQEIAEANRLPGS